MSVTDEAIRKQQVDYELQVYDELPPRSAGGGGGKSILNEQLEKIQGNTELHGKIVRIGLYTKGTAATAAKNVLQQRNGRTPAVRGWKFETRRVPNDPSNPDAGTKMGLFAIFTPDRIVAGALEAHEAAEKVRKAKLKELRAQRADDADESGEDVEGDEDEDVDEDDDEFDGEDEDDDEVAG